MDPRISALKPIPLNELGRQHYLWVEAQGWHNKPALSSLALIGSEIGEATAECLDDKPTSAFGEELADVILRSVDFAQTEGVDIETEVTRCAVEWRTQSLSGRMGELCIEWSRWVNAARHFLPEGQGMGTLPEFCRAMGLTVRRVLEIGAMCEIDLHAEVLRKMAINAKRGSRGRVV
jgi:hypothetical protein